MRPSSSGVLPVQDLPAFFAKAVDSLWQARGHTARLGLAISGGVDSMALASLCRETAAASTDHKPAFTGFVVDHKLRRGSTEEAHRVCEALQHLRIRPRILTLDWSRYGSSVESLTNLESVARRLRYQALGQACRDEGIASLLVAHHADDQAETVLSRLLGNYLGAGLRGVKSSTPIPECEGLHGISQSGYPRLIGSMASGDRGAGVAPMLVEGGGIAIERPLLGITKSQLVNFCQDRGVVWFEDHTNADRTYTIRNTVRHLLVSDHLPKALQRSRLLALAASVAANEAEVEHHAQCLFNAMKIELDARGGRACIIAPELSKPQDSPSQRAYSARAVCARKMLQLVSPSRHVNSQEVQSVVDLLWPGTFHPSTSTGSVQVAGVNVRVSSGYESQLYTLERTMPTKRERAGTQVELFTPNSYKRHESTSSYSAEWHLWDNRYWLQVGGPLSDRYQSVMVRFLEPNDISQLRQGVEKAERKELESLLSVCQGNKRYTIPALIAVPVTNTPDSTSPPRVIGLPTLGWSAPGWTRRLSKSDEESQLCWWDVRYRNIDFPRSDKHSVKASIPSGRSR